MSGLLPAQELSVAVLTSASPAFIRVSTADRTDDSFKSSRSAILLRVIPFSLQTASKMRFAVVKLVPIVVLTYKSL